MRPLLRAAMGVALLSIAGSFDAPSSVPDRAEPAASVQPLLPMPCPPRHLPEGDVCVPLEREGRVATNLAREAMLPLARERPTDFARYAGPIDGGLRPIADTSMHEAAGVVALSARRGQPVRLVELEGQIGDAVFVAGDRLVGNTVITAHEIEHESARRTILLVHGRLDAFAPDLREASALPPGALLGFVGDSGDPGRVRLSFEARLVREDIRVEGLALGKLVDPAISMRIDPRNVLRIEP